MEHLKIKIKFYIANVDLIRNQILSLGADAKGNAHEIDLCFDDMGDSLMKKKALLRLRKDKTTTLMFKTLPVLQDKDFKELDVVRK